jgi:quinol-cytochrome oxidoreductase complex cytochrome b subunit
LRRFTALHFLVAFISIICIAIHIILLHRQSPSKSVTEISDGVETLGIILVKDLTICMLFVGIVFFDTIKTLVHPDN